MFYMDEADQLTDQLEEEFIEWYESQSQERIDAIIRRAKRLYDKEYYHADEKFDYWEDREFIALFAQQLNYSWTEDVMRELEQDGEIECYVESDGQLAANSIA